ncbi:MAG: DUF6498-containing protein [Trueperaceae bacterium]
MPPDESTSVSTPWAIAALVGVNLFPLVGVAFLGWSIYDLMLLYWFENGVVGLYAALKMLATEGEDGAMRGPAGLLGKLFLVGFFTVHYGAFWSAHGFFVVTLFGPGGGFGAGGGPFIGGSLDGPLGFFAGGLPIASRYVTGGLLGAAMGLLVSHGISFVGNVLQRGEDLRTAPNVLMTRPYTRVVVLHVTLILGGFLVMGLGEPLAALLLFVVLKTGVDLAAHLRAHRPR